MNIERLKTLRDVIAATPDEVVDLDRWQLTKDCGTIACILGWACEVPEFQAAGLKLVPHQGNPARWVPEYDLMYREFRAGAKFFGLSSDTARLLFGQRAADLDTENKRTGDVRTDREVALDRLDHLIKHGNFNALLPEWLHE